MTKVEYRQVQNSNKENKKNLACTSKMYVVYKTVEHTFLKRSLRCVVRLYGF